MDIRETGMSTARLRYGFRRTLQALALLFAVAQAAGPLLHMHFADGTAGDSGVHIHLGMSVPPAADPHPPTREIRDFEARILTAPDAYFKDEPFDVLDLPVIGDICFSTRDEPRADVPARFVAVLSSAPHPFPKPLPLAPPASA
jgi:hypothetical protein